MRPSFVIASVYLRQTVTVRRLRWLMELAKTACAGMSALTPAKTTCAGTPTVKSATTCMVIRVALARLNPLHQVLQCYSGGSAEDHCFFAVPDRPPGPP